MAETLLITGIHHEELAFGDRVSELCDHTQVDVMRVPQGISHARTGTDDEFYFATQHREIYLQLKQQVKSNYKLLIDLHCGLTENGLYAEIFTHDDDFIDCMTAQLTETGRQDQVRLIKIIAEFAKRSYTITADDSHPKARTWIPASIWNSHSFAYVGLEIYLSDQRQGTPNEWEFTRELISEIQHCYGRF